MKKINEIVDAIVEHEIKHFLYSGNGVYNLEVLKEAIKQKIDLNAVPNQHLSAEEIYQSLLKKGN